MGRFFVRRQQSRRQGRGRERAEPHDTGGLTGGHIVRLGGLGGVGGILLRGGGFFRLGGRIAVLGLGGIGGLLRLGGGGVNFSSLSVKVTVPLLLLSEEFQSQ